MFLTEQLEDVRGEVIESSKQRRRERADLVRPIVVFVTSFQMSEMNNIAVRIDKGKEQYDSFNQLLQVLHKELGAIIKVLQIQHALDQQDDSDRDAIFLMGIKENSSNPIDSESPSRLPQISRIDTRKKFPE